MISILVDAHCFDGAGQGIVSYIQGIYSELSKNPEYEITLACSDEDKAKMIMGTGIKTLLIPKQNFLYRLLFFFPKVLSSGKYQYAHFQYILPFVLSSKTKYVTTIHDIIPIDFPSLYSVIYRLKVLFLFKRAARKSDIVLTVSEYSKKRISERFKVHTDKIFVTPNAVKNVFSSIPIHSNSFKRPYFLFVSRIEERKNHLLLLKIFVNQEYYKNFDLVFVGKNSSKNVELFRYFSSLSQEIKDSVRFISDISDTELSEYYVHSTLFIYPSIAEGFGIPPLEAALLGCKVVCSNATAMEDFDFFKKYSFSPYSEKEMATKIVAALNDNDYPFETIKQQICERYSWKSSCSVLEKLFVKAEVEL